MVNYNNLPSSVSEMFKAGDSEYIFTSDEGMNNIESMKFLMERLGLVSGVCIESKYELVVDDGTRIIISEPGEFKLLVIDSRGRGDEFDHAFDTELLVFDNQEQVNKYLS